VIDAAPAESGVMPLTVTVTVVMLGPVPVAEDVLEAVPAAGDIEPGDVGTTTVTVNGAEVNVRRRTFSRRRCTAAWGGRMTRVGTGCAATLVRLRGCGMSRSRIGCGTTSIWICCGFAEKPRRRSGGSSRRRAGCGGSAWVVVTTTCTGGTCVEIARRRGCGMSRSWAGCGGSDWVLTTTWIGGV
jgi:hypothetical protein